MKGDLMKRSLILALVLSGFLMGKPQSYVNTNNAAKLYICATPQNSDLDQTGYEALTWVEVKAIGNHGETGSNTNILSYDTWDLAVIDKAKGMTDAGSPMVEVARLPFDPGQILLRAAASGTNQNKYAFKMTRNDPIFSGGLPTILYNRGLVTGPIRPHGRNEDFDVEQFTLALVQLEIAVNPTASGALPAYSVLPAITGTATVGQTLSLSNGTWSGTPTYTYQWYAGGIAISGATANTFVLTAAQLGKLVQARVVASNAMGSAQAFSNSTAAIA